MNEDAELKVKTLTDSLARLEADYDTLHEENERLKRLELAVIAWSRAKKVGTMEKADFELFRNLVDSGMAGFLRLLRE